MSRFKESAWADNKFAANYLDRADIYIPERREMIGFVSSFFTHFLNSEGGIKLLDLGCGDGILTEELLKTGNSIAATLVDGNEGMLQKAQERLNTFKNVLFKKASFQEIINGRADLEYYNCCISSMAIHHLEMMEKAALYRHIADHLLPGGYFVNIDVVLPPSAELEGWYFALWRDGMKQLMAHFNITDEAPEDIIMRYKNPSSMNKPDTLGAQLKALDEAGFIEVDCYFKSGIFVVFGGQKS